MAGVGALGFHHARLLRELAGDAFAGVFDSDAARAAHVGRELGVRAFARLEDLLDAADAVSVAAATRAHLPIALAAAAAGRHLFLEKPVTATVAEADALAAQLAGRGLVVQAGHIERWNPAVRAARGVLRDVRLVDAVRHNAFTPRGADVSVVHDLMIHDLDLAAWLVGSPPTRVDATGARLLRPTTDAAEARVAFANGAVARCTTMRLADRSEGRRTLTAWQADGVVVLDLAARTAEYRRVRGDADLAALAASPQPEQGAFLERVALPVPEGETLRLELEAWLGAIATGTPPPVPFEDGRRAVVLCEAVETAIATGQPVHVGAA